MLKKPLPHIFLGFCLIVISLTEAYSQSTVNYLMQVGNFNALDTEKNFDPPFAGTINNGGSEIQQFADNGSFGNTPGAAAFQTFSENGNGNMGETRPLEVGDRFSITVFTAGNPSSGGRIGISFRTTSTVTDFFSSTDANVAANFQLDNLGGWKIYHNAGNNENPTASPGNDRTLTIEITSSNTFNANIAGVDYFDLEFSTSGPIVQFCVYTFGDSNPNSFWKNGSLSNIGGIAGNGIRVGYSLTSGETLDLTGEIEDASNTNGSSGGVNNTVRIGGAQNSEVILNANNLYSGETFINPNATAILKNSQSLGTIGPGSQTTVVNDGVLSIDYDNTSPYPSEDLILNGEGFDGLGSLRKIDFGSDLYGGNILLNSDSRINSENGTLQISSARNINANGNTIYIGGSGNISFKSGSDFQGLTKFSGQGALVKDGSGRLEIRPNSTMTGNITLDAGELRHFSGDYPSPSAGTFLFNGGKYSSSSGATREIPKATVISGNVELGNSSASYDGDILISGDVDLSAEPIISMFNTNTISGTITDGSFTKAGTGSLTLQGSTANTLSLSNGSVVNAGSLILAKDAGLRATSGLSIQAGATVQTNNDNQWGTTEPPFIQIFGGTLNVNNTNQRLALAGNASASVTLGAGTITIDGTGDDTFAGVISGTGGLTKEGVGTQILSGNSTYTGNTVVRDGVLRIGADNSIDDASSLEMDGGMFETNGNSEELNTLILSSSSTIALQTGTSHSLTFSESQLEIWNTDAILTITGWAGVAEQTGTGCKVSVSSPTGLTAEQLLRIQFENYDFGAMILSSGEIVPKTQNIIRFDDFNRGENDTLGMPSGVTAGLWEEFEVPSANCVVGDRVQINASKQLELNLGSDPACGASDYKMAAFNISNEYSTIFESADGLMEWYFNFRIDDGDNDPSAQNRSAFILGSTESDFTSNTAQGYAVAIGESETPDNLKLIAFPNGIPTTNALSSSLLTTTVTTTDAWLSVRVTFNPCSNQWNMFVREDTGSFRDPTTIVATSSTTVNTDFTNTPLTYLGVYMRHTGSDPNVFIDNIYIPKTTALSTTYAWNGSESMDYQNPENWTPNRTCAKSNDILNFTLITGNDSVTNIPSEFIQELNISGTGILTLSDAVGNGTSSRLTIRNGSWTLGPTSALVMDAILTSDVDDALEIELIGSSTANLDGNIIVRKSSGLFADPAHRIIAEGAGAIQVNGTITIEDLQGSLFDGGAANSVEFNAGSTYECFDGANPFGLAAPASRVVFETGSTYRYLDNLAGLSVNGRSYSNFEFNTGTSRTLAANSGNPWTVNSLLILSGTLEIQPSGTSYDILVSGDLHVDNTAIFNFTPAEEVKLTLNGNQGQRIYGTGTITLGENVTFSIDNSAIGSTVELEKDLTVFNDFELLDGEMQGTGSTLTMQGVDHHLRVESDLVGEVSGADDEINLVIAENTTLIGVTSQCDFLNITINANKSFRLERGIRCLLGLFDVQSGSELIMGSGGFIDGTGSDAKAPTYQLGSTLIYDLERVSTVASNPYYRGFEWSSNSDPGQPDNVVIRGNTSVAPVGILASYFNIPLHLTGNITIESGSTFFMDSNGDMQLPLLIGGDLILDGSLSGAGAVGGDVEIMGNWEQSVSGLYFPNQRQVRFTGSTPQTIDAPVNLEFAFIQVNNPNGVSIENDIQVSDLFDFTNGIVTPDSDDLDGVEKLIFQDGSAVGAVSNSSHYQGVVVKEGATVFIFPVGDTSSIDMTTFLYQPVRIFDLGGIISIEAQYFSQPHPEAGPWYDGSTGANGELEEVGNCDYWEINKTNSGPHDAKVSFSYTNSESIYCNDIGDVNTLTIASFNGFLWDPVAPDISTSGEIASISVIDENPGGGTPGSYGFFTFRSANGADNILPITLLSFEAKALENLVRTDWITASEINNDFFAIERSKDGNYWEKVGTIKGAGDSHTELSYSFTDQRPYSGISYYRLRQTDFDGTTTLSAPRAVEILQGNDFGIDRVYRGQDGLSLIYRATAPYVVVEIYDLLGKRIHGELIENYGNGFSTIHPDLARGAYILRLSHGSEMDSEKFVW